MTARHIQSGSRMTRCENGGSHNVKSPPVVSALETWANTNRNAASPQVAIIASRVSFFICEDHAKAGTPKRKTVMQAR
jgi:hypothetical protein